MKIHEFDSLQSETLKAFIRRITDRTGVDRAGLFRFDPEYRLLQGVIGIDDDGQLENIRQGIFYCSPQSNGLLEKVALGLEPYARINSPVSDTLHGVDEGGNGAVPVIFGGEIIGVLAVDNKLTRRPISQDTLDLLIRESPPVAPILASLKVIRPVDLMENVVETLTEGVCLSGQPGWIIYCNPALARIYGSSPEDVYGKQRGDFFSPFAADGTDDPQREEMSEGIRNGLWTGVTHNRKADGTLFPVRLTFTSLREGSNVDVQVVVVKDLSLEKALAETQRQKSELEGVLKLARALQHEINNPLQVILGSLELMRATGQLPEKSQRHLQRAMDGTEKMAEVIQKLQKVTRVQTMTTDIAPILDIHASSERPPSQEPESDDPHPLFRHQHSLTDGA